MKIQKSKPMRELVYEELKRLIIEGEIEPGSRIVETEYAEKFQISRTPIREAIRMLELEGFVESQSKGGVIVKTITKDDIEEIYRIRIALESIIIEEVIKKAGARDIRRLTRLMEDTEDLMAEYEDEKEVFELFSEFNNILYDIADLNRVREMITNIKLYLSSFRRIAIENEERREIAFKDHKAIVEAIKEKDISKALEVNKLHLERSRDFIVGSL
ncbi:GntR family transcriptional regulator [Propionigenium maris DSM 9537]|uniref:GntR family transcriptional regulator n=1 Tax=Propionigenium maris DSM 9537 TaxID=1123000 RepID=A0A9W6GP90_9FUSO|nr:GntR family transcriptional regulator [Propionigenium maris]GLI57509.1 GntR family transcriptional regulator [Propionigenium maris DSM 9537]